MLMGLDHARATIGMLGTKLITLLVLLCCSVAAASSLKTAGESFAGVTEIVEVRKTMQQWSLVFDNMVLAVSSASTNRTDGVIQ